ncbi:MAG: LemA family protein [Candidatus Nanoarchaeia archaeon]
MQLLAWILIAVAAIIVLYIIITYNSLVRLNMRINNAWSQIDVQLKRRYDLIPNLVNTVKGYMKHERTVLENITKARSAMMKATTLSEKAKHSDTITNALKTLFAVAENYPKLRANENFMMLQEELSGTENKIAYSRQFYNDSVMVFNTKIKTFPTNIFANILNFKEREFFKTEGKERESVKVEF